MPGRKLIVGTRGSRLALEQARRVRALLSGPSDIRIIRTSGDRFQDKPLHEQNGVGFFTKEIEQELLSGRVDLAVHSLKDLPTALAPGLVLGALLARDEASDLLLVREEARDTSQSFPVRSGARVGASSLRRQALLRGLRADLQPAPIRGNVPTRVDKLRAGDYDAIILSRAGLVRLGLDVEPLLAFDLNPDRWICAPGQGVIAVEAREEDHAVLERLRPLQDEPTWRCTRAERSLLVTYGGGCHAPFGSYARPGPRGYRLTVAAPGSDGSFRVQEFRSADLDETRGLAENWIRAGCPPGDPREAEEWTARPARPWS